MGCSENVDIFDTESGFLAAQVDGVNIIFGSYDALCSRGLEITDEQSFDDVDFEGEHEIMYMFRENKLAMYAVVAACCVIAVALNYFLRCPHCGAWPRKGSFFHEFCPRCGKRLDD
jgi:hypothetical protein